MDDLAEDIVDKKNHVAQNSADIEASQHTVDQKQSPVCPSDASRSHQDDNNSINSAPQPATSTPRVLSADLIAAILGSAPVSNPTPIAVPIPSPELPAKKKKSRGPPVKVFKAMKEIKEATALLHGQVDLTLIFSEEECRFLAEKLWIVTAQQLENVLHPQTEGHTNAREELIKKLAVSTLVAKHSDAPSMRVESKNDVRSDEGDTSSTEKERGMDPTRGDESPTVAGHQATPGGQDTSSALQLNMEEENKSQQSMSASLHTPTDNLTAMTEIEKEGSKFSSYVLDVHSVEGVASEACIAAAHSIRTGKDGASPTATTTVDYKFDTDVITAGGGSETVHTQISSLAEEPDARTLRQAAQPQDQNTFHSSLSVSEAHRVEENDPVCADSGSAAAIQVMESWDQKLRKRVDDQFLGNGTKQFFLDGPVSFLIPLCTRNFLKSAQIETVFEFLSLKRTETGVILDVYAEWRKKCELAECSRSTIAKHLVAVGARLEALIGSSCPLPGSERQWLGGHMIVLGGSAKDFLVYMGVLDSHLFLTTTTKELSNKLAKWRNKKGLEPLKGTGKVAMVSAWKTQIREALDLELNTGQVLSDDWMKSLNIQEFDVSKKHLPLKQRPSKKLPSLPHTVLENVGIPAQSVGTKEPTMSLASMSDGTLAGELASNDLLNAIFEKDVVNVMASIDILSGKELMAADTRPDSKQVDALFQIRKESSGGADKGSCILELLEWQRVLNLGLEKRKNELMELDQENVSHEEDGEVELNPSRKLSNPWDVLSDGARSFLVSINITNAEMFLGGKTKHLAEHLVLYRETHNLVPLRGSGAVASVSGWKALVRKAASELGYHELAALNAGRNAGIKLKRRKRKGGYEEDESLTEVTKTTKSPKTASPPKKSRRLEPPSLVQLYVAIEKFSVRKAGEVFSFDLSVRHCSRDPSLQSFYLTYLGNEMSAGSDSISEVIDGDFPVLDHVSTTSVIEYQTRPFLSRQTGLIELERYGIEPGLQRASGLSVIKEQLKAYITQDECASSFDPHFPYNVFECRTVSGTPRYYFFSAGTLEKGQTVELNFLPPSPPTSRDDELRKWINMELSCLQVPDLKRLLDFINDEFGADIYIDVDRIFALIGSERPSSKLSSNESVKEAKRVAVARRRMHWLAVIIAKAFEKALVEKGDATTGVSPSVISSLWTSELIASLSMHPLWQDHIRPLVREESRNEILAEFRSPARGGFWTSQELWCSVAERTFNETLTLFSQFNAELDSFCSEEDLIHDLAKNVTEAVLILRKHNSMYSTSRSELDPFLLNFDRNIENSSNIFPPTNALWAMLNQNYLDCMALAGDPPMESSLLDKGRFLAVKSNAVPEFSRSRPTEFRFIQDFDPSTEKIDLEWYVQAQVVAVAESVAVCGATLLGRGSTKLSEISAKFFERVTSALGGHCTGRVEFRERLREETPVVPRAILDVSNFQVCKPESRSVFLHVVWPHLRTLKWRIEAGTESSSVTYTAPGQEKDKRALLVRQAAAVARADVVRKTLKLGFGGFPKDVKRLLIICTSVDQDSNADGSPSTAFTVAQALRFFEESFPSSNRTIHATIEQLKVLFEEVAPSLVSKDRTSTTTPPNGQYWRDCLGCEFLVRILFALPKIIYHSDVSDSQVEITMGVAKELLACLADNRMKLLAETLQYPQEEYVSDFVFKAFIEDRLERAAITGNENSPEGSLMESDLKEVVLPSDRHELTDFVTTVMDQVIVCRATREDVKVRGRRSFLVVGDPGLVCRHCLGESGEGKYFYSNMQSLATASTSVDKHILRCPKISDEIRCRMLEAKSRNAEQRSKTRQGAQSAFFVRLWNRLQRLRTLSAGAEANANAIQWASTLEPSVDSQFRSAGDAIGFGDHIEVLRYVQSEDPWKSNLALQEALSHYYSCLAWGAGIFNTDAMPQNFSSEWVLAKLGHL